jgi:hypothetical protein
MEAILNRISIGQLKTKRFVLYYTLFTLSYVLIHYSLVSVVAFFHFLLDHELATIEQWLNYNGWEIILSSKLIAFSIFNRVLKLNFYTFSFRQNILEKTHFAFNIRLLIMIVGLHIFMFGLGEVFQFNLLYQDVEYNSSLLLSFFGTTIFYLIDYLMLMSIDHCVKLVRPRVIKGINYYLPFLFYAASLLILPNLDKNQHFLFFNYFMLVAIYYKDRSNLMNPLLYSVLAISLMSLLWGLDLVWIDKNAFLKYDQTIPWLGYFLVWLTCFVYYIRTPR